MYVRCPQCALPAEITDRFTLASTDGPLDHLKIGCRGGHWFTPLAEDVEALEMSPAAEPMEAWTARRAAA
jgi:hypothetical protein